MVYGLLASNSFLNFTPVVIGIFVILAIWESVWKGIGLWKSGRNKQLAWFICIFIFNTIGILPIIYLLFFGKDKKENRRPRQRKRSSGRKR